MDPFLYIMDDFQNFLNRFQNFMKKIVFIFSVNRFFLMIVSNLFWFML